jgi:hypothetical protein
MGHVTYMKDNTCLYISQKSEKKKLIWESNTESITTWEYALHFTGSGLIQKVGFLHIITYVFMKMKPIFLIRYSESLKISVIDFEQNQIFRVYQMWPSHTNFGAEVMFFI